MDRLKDFIYEISDLIFGGAVLLIIILVSTYQLHGWFNISLPENIEKIIDTYANRKEIEKYSHLASMKEIKENDYNLNIPRYVDTFEEEEVIDLDKVSSELKALEIEMKTTDETIASFCRELNISTPF